MADMLVNLLQLPDCDVRKEAQAKEIKIHRALAPDMQRICDWIATHSTPAAADECRVCFSRTPTSCFVASRAGQVLGYACYNAIAPDFFGPTAVDASLRGQGIGRLLLIRCLQALREEGYVYAIIGSVGPVQFYEKCVGAVPIAGSTPGIYEDFLGGQCSVKKP